MDPAVGGNLPECYRAIVAQENSSDHRTSHKKNRCNWMALFDLNMELETWIAVDGHHFPNVSRYTCGGVSI